MKDILKYETRIDKLDNGKTVWDIYELYEGDSVCLDKEFDSQTDAVKYIRDELNWKGSIVTY